MEILEILFQKCQSELQNRNIMTQTERIGRYSIIANDLIRKIDNLTMNNR